MIQAAGPPKKPSPVQVALTLAEVHFAVTTGAKRQLEAMRMGLKDRYGAKPSEAWGIHIEGAAGEMAVAKALGIYWQAGVNTFHDPDVGDLQVRTRSRHDYELIVRENDNDKADFVLVTGRIPTFQVIGYIRGRDAKRSEWLRTHGGRAPAYFVPQAALNPIRNYRRHDASAPPERQPF